jgi:hypothetical protein
MVSPMDVETPLSTYIWPRIRDGEVHTLLMLIGLTGYAPFILPATVAWITTRRILTSEPLAPQHRADRVLG